MRGRLSSVVPLSRPRPDPEVPIPMVGREAEEENLAAHMVIETTRENDSLVFVVRKGEVPPSARLLFSGFLA